MLKQPISQCTLPVVNMCDYTKIPNMLHVIPVTLSRNGIPFHFWTGKGTGFMEITLIVVSQFTGAYFNFSQAEEDIRR